MKPSIMVVDDDAAMGQLVCAALEPLGFEVHCFVDPKVALRSVRGVQPDIVLTDLRMPGMTGLEICAQLKEIAPSVPVIVMTGFGTMDAAVNAIRHGAYDFLAKPVDLDTLELAVKRALERRTLGVEIRRLQEAEPSATVGIVGSSPAIRTVLDLIPRIGQTDVPVLVHGETGTGKELLARGLHAAGNSPKGPFIAVNCSAIPENLLESELFGHVKGAFTDAQGARPGLFVQASGGTLFLDEIGELPLSAQPKLLRALQNGKIRPVGSDKEVSLNCRVITATNRDLRAEVQSGGFRADLYYRIAVIKMTMPPLRERAGDIIELAGYFIQRAARRRGIAPVALSTQAAKALLSHHWPGNVRELENAVERAMALCDGGLIAVSDFSDEISKSQVSLSPASPPSVADAMLPLAEIERRHIQRVLSATSGNKKAAAEVLGLDRRTLYRKLEKYEEDD